MGRDHCRPSKYPGRDEHIHDIEKGANSWMLRKGHVNSLRHYLARFRFQLHSAAKLASSSRPVVVCLAFCMFLFRPVLLCSVCLCQKNISLSVVYMSGCLDRPNPPANITTTAGTPPAKEQEQQNLVVHVGWWLDGGGGAVVDDVVAYCCVVVGCLFSCMY